MWLLYAILSAVFAAIVAILARIGLDGVNSHLATAIRTVVVLAFAWGMVFITGAWRYVGEVSNKNWLFLVLSGIATGASWLFYFAALQRGDVSRVVPIDKLSVVLTMILAIVIFRESFDFKTIAGMVLITGGTLLMVL